jgi:hypothetical protein
MSAGGCRCRDRHGGCDRRRAGISRQADPDGERVGRGHLLRDPAALQSLWASAGDAKRSLTPCVMSKAQAMFFAQSTSENALTASTASSMFFTPNTHGSWNVYWEVAFGFDSISRLRSSCVAWMSHATVPSTTHAA